MLRSREWSLSLIHLVALLIFVSTLTACSGASILNSIVPRSGYSVQADIPFGADARQKLDIYIPDKLSQAPATILFFYGGSWQYGDKEMYRFVGQALASQGFIVVIANYRLYPQVHFPAFMQDSAKALVWVHRHIQAYGGTPNKVFLAGHSAGGFNAVMLTLNPAYLDAEGGNGNWIKGTMGIAGPYDFLPLTDPKIIALFSNSTNADTQPINFVHPGLPPLLLVTGDADTEVYPKNAFNLQRKLRQNHDPVQLIVYPQIGHIGIILSLAYGFRSKTSLLNDITVFVKQHSR